MATSWDDFPAVGQAPAAPAFPGVIPGRPRVPPPPTPTELERLEMERRRLGMAESQETRDVAVFEGTGGNPTEAQGKAGTLLTRIEGSSQDIDDILRRHPGSQSPGYAETILFNQLGEESLIARGVTEWQRVAVRDAQTDVIDAMLTLATGAAYTPEQLVGQRVAYFPQPGDTPEQIQFKRRRLERLAQAARAQAGPLAPRLDAALAGLVGPLPSGEETDEKARDPETRGGLPVGTEIEFNVDAPDDPFDRAAYLQERYGIDPNQEALATAFWNTNRGNQNLTPQAVKDWYSGKGLVPPSDEDIARGVEDAKAGKQFGGINTERAEKEYVGGLDAALEARGADPESVTGAVGVNTAQGIMMEGLDEVSGIGGFLGAAIRLQNPVAGYQVERDLVRREVQRARHAHPIVSGVATVGGSLLTGGAGFQAPVRIGNAALTAQRLGHAARATSLSRQAIGSATRAGAVTGALVGYNAGQGALGSGLGATVGAGGGALLGAGAQAAAPYVSGALNRVLPSRAPATAHQLDVIAAGERRGVPIRQPDVRPELRNQRSVARTSERGGRIIREAEAQDVEALENAIERDLTSNAASPSREIMGENAQEALDRVRQTSSARIGAQYDQAREMAGEATFTPRNALAELDEQIADLESKGPNANRALIGYLRDIREDLTQGGPINTGILDAKGNPITRPPAGLNIDAIRSQRTNMRGQISERNLTRTDAERRVGRVLDAASRDIEEGLAGNQAALGEFRSADNAWRERHQFIKQIMEKVTGPENNRKSGSAAASTLEGWIKGDHRRLRRLWAELDPNERAEIAATVADSLGRNMRGEFSLAEFVKHVGTGRGSRLSERSARLIFGDDGVRAIEDLRVIARAKIEAGAQTNTSNTGNIVQASGRGVRNLILASLGMSVGDVGGAVVAPAAGSFLSRLGEERAARMLINPDFTGWLRRLPNTANPDVINRHFARLDSLAARTPGMAADVDAFKQALIGAVNDNAPSRLAAEPGNADEPRQAQQ